MTVYNHCQLREEEAERSLALTLRWAERSQAARTMRERVLAFGIVQGGMYPELRQRAASELVAMNFDGYAIGGLSVGEPTALMAEMTDASTQVLPADRVRYLMGVGTPQDIVRSVGMGIDMFDCVIPTRSARFGRLYVGKGYINIRNRQYRADPLPIEADCDCYACANFSRAYVSHLIHADEILYAHSLNVRDPHGYKFASSKYQNVLAFLELNVNLLHALADELQMYVAMYGA